MTFGFVGGKGYPKTIIGDVVLALPLDEADAEEDPIVIADDDQASFWTPDNATITLTNETTGTIPSGTNYLKAVFLNSAQWKGFRYTYVSNQNWSTTSKLRFRFKGANSGKTLRVAIEAPDPSNIWYYDMVDNSSDWRQMDILVSSMTSQGSPSLTTAKKVSFYVIVADVSVTWCFDRVVMSAGVAAVDYSGYGNDGVATGTTIQTTGSRWLNKNVRHFNLDSFIKILDAAVFDVTNKITIYANVKIDAGGLEQGILTKAGAYSVRVAASNYLATYTYGLSKDYYSFTGEAVTPASWTSVAFTYDGATKTIYKDATSGSEAATGNLTTNSQDVYIGNLNLLGWDFVGNISDVLLFSEPLSSTQITALRSGYPDPTLLEGSICVLDAPANSVFNRRMFS